MFSKNKLLVDSYLSKLPEYAILNSLETLPNDLKPRVFDLFDFELVPNLVNDVENENNQPIKKHSCCQIEEKTRLKLADFKRIIEERETDKNKDKSGRNESQLDKQLDEFIDWTEANFNQANIRSDVMYLLNPRFDHSICLGTKSCKLERVEDPRYLETIYRSQFGNDYLTSSAEKLHMSELNAETNKKNKNTSSKREDKSICKKLKKLKITSSSSSQEKRTNSKELAKNETNSDSVRKFIDYFRKRKNDRFPYSFPRY